MIFQDPYQSLNPRFTVFDIVSEPLIIHRLAREPTMRAQVIETLDQVGLRPAASYLHRFPHELSGGQRQRVAIARAVVLQPRLMVADEPVSMLDVSVRAGILRLLRSFSRDFGLSVIYISHDISTVRYLCDRVAVMYLGRIVEIGPTSSVLDAPKHPYTTALLAAVPRIRAGGSAPSGQRWRATCQGSVQRPAGCIFHPRCPRAFEPCDKVAPALLSVDDKHEVACCLFTRADLLFAAHPHTRLRKRPDEKESRHDERWSAPSGGLGRCDRWGLCFSRRPDGSRSGLRPGVRRPARAWYECADDRCRIAVPVISSNAPSGFCRPPARHSTTAFASISSVLTRARHRLTLRSAGAGSRPEFAPLARTCRLTACLLPARCAACNSWR